MNYISGLLCYRSALDVAFARQWHHQLVGQAAADVLAGTVNLRICCKLNVCLAGSPHCTVFAASRASITLHQIRFCWVEGLLCVILRIIRFACAGTSSVCKLVTAGFTHFTFWYLSQTRHLMRFQCLTITFALLSLSQQFLHLYFKRLHLELPTFR